MEPFKGLKLDIKSNGTVMELFDDNDEVEPPDRDHATRNHYVQATPGATFSISVTFKPSFDISGLRAGDAVRVSVHYSTSKTYHFQDITREHFPRPRGTGTCPKAIFSSIDSYDATSGKWSSGLLTFSDLVTVDSNNMSLKPDQIKDLGRIRIEVQRVHRKDLGRTYNPSTASILDDPSDIPEKSLKGKPISSAISVSNMKEIAAPKPKEYSAWPLAGRPGKVFAYNVFYRSKRDLQILGCIPRSPSPEPDLEEENRELRARLALYEADPNRNVKTEAGLAARVKRERGEAEIARSRKRSRGLDSGVIDLTDLTDD